MNFSYSYWNSPTFVFMANLGEGRVLSPSKDTIRLKSQQIIDIVIKI